MAALLHTMNILLDVSDSLNTEVKNVRVRELVKSQKVDEDTSKNEM